MRLKTFRAFSLSEALDAVQQDLGPAAAILHTRTFKQGGFLGLGGRDVVEVIASEATADESATPSPVIGGPDAGSDLVSDMDRGRETGRRLVASRAYARAEHDVEPSVEPTTSRSGSLEVDLEVDRARTRRLAQAMAVRLEKQQAAREAAGVASGEDVLVASESTGRRAANDVSGQTVPSVQPANQASTAMPAEPSVEAEPAVTAGAGAATETESVGRFVIGAGGILIPDDAPAAETPTRASVDHTAVDAAVSEPLPADSAPSLADADADADAGDVESPRLVCLDDGPLTAATETGVPVVSSDAAVSEALSASMTASDPTSRPEASASEQGQSAGGTELDAIRSTVGRVLDSEMSGIEVPQPPSARTDLVGDPLAGAYATLIGQELSRDLADQVVAELEVSLDPAVRRDPVEVRNAVLDRLANLIPTEESIGWASPRDGRPRTIAFVGPTGVGKTTTLAKIAATLVLREKLSVGFVTADTYRISAVDQLRTYADILGARLEVASDAQGMREAMDRCAGLDAVLIDTPGRSQNDADRLGELRGLMDAANPHETHLVLSGTASERVLLREAEAFSQLGPDRVVLTKLDEAVAFGMLVSVVRRIGRRISWVTTGQEVPRDVEHATGTRLASLVLGGPVR